MTDARIGRLLAACLHQAIGDVLPQRLDFYEVWLRSEGLRDGSIGAAPMMAVLGFLRTEDAYEPVVAGAGRLAAQWTIASMAPVQRRFVSALPRALRARVALRIVAGLMRRISTTSHVSARVRGNTAQIDVKESIFCSVRALQKVPLCGFYVAAATEALSRFQVPTRARTEQCLAVAGSSCVIALELLGADATADPAIAA